MYPSRASRDLGSLRADGCLRFLGRYKDMLKVDGENVDPMEMEIEGFLLEDPRINHAVAVGLPGAHLAEAPVAFVITEAGAILGEQEVIELRRGRISSFPRRAGEGSTATRLGRARTRIAN